MSVHWARSEECAEVNIAQAFICLEVLHSRDVWMNNERQVLADAAAAGISEADCKAPSALQTQRMLEQAQEKAATAANAANERIDGDETALCLLEAQSDLPVELVQLAAQYSGARK